MPLALAIIGIALLVTAIRGTQADVFSLLKSDIPGWGKWAAAIVAIGLIGYIPDLEKPARALLVLVLIVILLANKGLFTTLSQDFTSPPAASAGSALGNPTVTVNLGGSGGSTGGLFGGAINALTGGAAGAVTGGSGNYGTTGTGGL